MPVLKIQTNTELTLTARSAFLTQASSTLANMLGKPERYVMIVLEINDTMSFAGNGSPLAYLELKSIGLPIDRTTEFSKTLSNLITEHLQIPADRVYIEFADAQRHMWGWNGGTF
ncbi:MAG: phenylpyruvate tautomerase MIF-related protein [Gammaproteobacteria bacterium]|nr:phenylpyruvate tautomerase MIF-related protein [Gammaproteobacteria bacterium]